MRNRLVALLLLACACACDGETTFFTGVADTAIDSAGGDADAGDDQDVGAGSDAETNDAHDVEADGSGDVGSDGSADVDPVDVTDDTAEDATDAGSEVTPDADADVQVDVSPDDAQDATDVEDADDAQDVADASDVTDAQDASDAQPDVALDAVADAPDDAGPFVCGEGVDFIGQMYIASDEPDYSPNGGVPRFTPYPLTFDAGLAAIRAAAPLDGETTSVALPVNRAIVVATSFNSATTRFAQTSFWLSDGLGIVRVFLADGALEPTVDIIVGTELSFTVTSLTTYQGAPQISAGANWVAHSTGNDVYVRELGSTPISGAADSLVRVTGTVTGTGTPCGGSSTCYTLARAVGAPLTLRSASRFIATGDCVTYLGPVIPFGDVLQLDTLNFDWLFDYTR